MHCAAVPDSERDGRGSRERGEQQRVDSSGLRSQLLLEHACVEIEDAPDRTVAMSRQARSCSSAARRAGAPPRPFSCTRRTSAPPGRRSDAPRSRCRASRAARRTSVNSDSWTRSSSGSTPSNASAHAGSSLDDRQLAAPAARDLVLEHRRRTCRGLRRGSRRRLERRSARPRPRPPSRRARHRPAGSSRSPADRRVVRARRLRSAPGRVRCRLRHSSRMIQRTESDLSVRPISTCLASLVTRGSARPASVAAPRAISTASVSPSMPAAARRACTAVSSSPIRAFGRSAQSGSGIRSILRRFNRSDTIRAASPRTANRSTVSCAARDRAASSSALAVRR